MLTAIFAGSVFRFPYIIVAHATFPLDIPLDIFDILDIHDSRFHRRNAA